ncbi:hypothetical protein CHELA20_50086 [Hyphomicrobiales bacterium]|nr:hypothetical protein CHELA41_20286 [Hyphomicrobiales bacterium]CAH1666586.1 hypothetical protein CHELA20_50086 [Hyphomicrobiales bacterium]
MAKGFQPIATPSAKGVAEGQAFAGRWIMSSPKGGIRGRAGSPKDNSDETAGRLMMARGGMPPQRCYCPLNGA